MLFLAEGIMENMFENIWGSGSDVRKFTDNRQWMTDKVR